LLPIFGNRFKLRVSNLEKFSMKILFRSCGGLGNQIFQLYFTRLLASKLSIAEIVHYHEANYSRIAHWEYPIAEEFSQPNFFEKLLLKLRLPQIIFRLGLSANEYLKLGNYVIIDGYFQSLDDYQKFDRSSVVIQLKCLQKDLLPSNYKYTNREKTILHFRLGDFFKDTQQQIQFIETVIYQLEPGTDVISNRDDLFLEHPKYIQILHSRYSSYVHTEELSSLELFKLFSNYNKIISNGSTLALWASILSNAEFYLSLGSNTTEKNLWMYNFIEFFLEIKISDQTTFINTIKN